MRKLHSLLEVIQIRYQPTVAGAAAETLAVFSLERELFDYIEH